MLLLKVSVAAQQHSSTAAQQHSNTTSPPSLSPSFSSSSALSPPLSHHTLPIRPYTSHHTNQTVHISPYQSDHTHLTIPIRQYTSHHTNQTVHISPYQSDSTHLTIPIRPYTSHHLTCFCCNHHQVIFHGVPACAKLQTRRKMMSGALLLQVCRLYHDVRILYA
jgi:hypothetical protein